MTEWKTYRLGDIAKFQTGKLNSNAAVENGKYPFFTCSPNTLAIDNYAFDKEAILLAGNNAEGNFSIKYYKGKFNAYQRTYIIETYNDKCDIKFLFYALKLCLQQFKLMSQGTSTKFLTAVILNNFEISLPSLEEQRRIAGILGAIDDKIENNRRINTNLELQAQALYKQWFVDNRCDDWKTLILDDVATLSAGGDKPPVCSDKKTPDCNIPIYSNGIDNEGLYGYTNRPRITENSITISARGTIGFVCLRTEPYVPIVRLISIVPTHENISAYFLYLWALTQNISGTGTTQQQLTVPAFRTTKIVVPSQEILIKFNKVVKPIFDSIKQYKKENITLATLRDTLLPKLMNGEIKL